VVPGQALHDHEGFTTFFDIKVFVIMKRHRKCGQSDCSDDWLSWLTGSGPAGY
jgi:hypothetical protein